MLDDARREWDGELGSLPRPRTLLLLGGAVTRRAWQRALAPPLEVAGARELAASVAAAAAAVGGSVLATASRRTPHAAADAAWLELTRGGSGQGGDDLGGGGGGRCGTGGGTGEGAGGGSGGGLWHGSPSGHWWDGSGPNPYLGYLAHADYVVVTADSINMASEAAAAGVPLYVSRPEACSGRFAAFHEDLMSRGLSRPWRGCLESPSLWSGAAPANDTFRAAAHVRELLLRRAAGTPHEQPLTKLLCSDASSSA